MRSLADRFASAPPPTAPAGCLFFDDFRTPARGIAYAINYAIRDIATYVSPSLVLPFGALAPSAMVENGLNQSVTVRWQVKEGAAWIDADAGTVVGAGANAIVPANSNRAPEMRLTAVAGVAPTSGTLYVRWDAPTPSWVTAGTGSPIALIQADRYGLAGPSLALVTRLNAPAANDESYIYNQVPLPWVASPVEFGALVLMDDINVVSKQFDLVAIAYQAGRRSVNAGVRLESPSSSGVLSAKDSGAAWVSVGSRVLNAKDWVDLRVAIDPSSGSYIYVALNGEVFYGGMPAYGAATPTEQRNVVRLSLYCRTLAASSAEIRVGRVWARLLA